MRMRIDAVGEAIKLGFPTLVWPWWSTSPASSRWSEIWSRRFVKAKPFFFFLLRSSRRRLPGGMVLPMPQFTILVISFSRPDTAQSLPFPVPWEMCFEGGKVPVTGLPSSFMRLTSAANSLSHTTGNPEN